MFAGDPYTPVSWYQRAYVTSDIDIAITHFAENFHVPTFKVLRDFALNVDVRGTPCRLILHLAFAWVGDLMLEIIEPQHDDTGLFAAGVADDGIIAVPHHVSYRIVGDMDLWLQHLALVRNSCEIIAEGGLGRHVRFAFIDQRAASGLYVEAAWHGSDGRGLPADVPSFLGPCADLLGLWPDADGAHAAQLDCA